jgi:hypothetical protein
MDAGHHGGAYGAGQAGSGEAIWEGRIHLGDEPGIYGDAAYAGLAMEFPVTLRPFSSTGGPADITFHLTANRIKIYPPYKGHRVAIFAYTPDTGSNPPTWTRRLVTEALMDQASIDVPVPGITTDNYFSVRLEVATDAQPGLYDDFVVRTFALKSSTHYADFGFRSV